MAHQASSLSMASNLQPYDPISASQDSRRHNDKKNIVSASITAISSGERKGFAQSWSATQVLLTGAIPLVALVAWLGRARANPHMFDTFAGERIGGRFSQAQAKAIDVITGAMLAPLFMAAVNHVWFDSARVSVVNEQQSKAIPFRTLVAASSTSTGNYDFFLLRDLFQGKTWRLFLLGLLTLLSAVSRSALSNIIAYEAYSVKSSSENLVSLRLQRGYAVEQDLPTTNYIGMTIYNFTKAQNTEVAKEMVALLTEVSYENAAVRLLNNTYVAMNATTQSLESLPQSVIELNNVPAYRLSVGCTPDVPISIRVGQPLSRLNTQIDLILNTTTLSNNTLFQANYPGVPGDIQTGDGGSYSFAAFSMGYQEVYLGHLDRFNLTNDTTSSAFGDVHYGAFNMTPQGFTGTQGVMSVGGIRCLLYREHGLLNATRADSRNSSTSTWAFSSVDFPVDQEKSIVRSRLSRFQWSGLNFHAPSSTIPGLGPALSSYGKVTGGEPQIADPFPDFAHNFLYTSGEAERILYEVAATSTNASQHPPNFSVNVPAFATEQHYRITYVPSILLLGLICLLGASIVTGAMAAYTRKSASARTHRQVNVTRLLVDSVLGLEGHKEDMMKAAQSANGDLDAWAAGYKVRYTSVDDEEGTVRIVLEKIQ